MKKVVLALAFIAAAAPAFAQTPGAVVMPSTVAPTVNTTQPPVANPQQPEAPKK
jgi:hypothetical protein